MPYVTDVQKKNGVGNPVPLEADFYSINLPNLNLRNSKTNEN